MNAERKPAVREPTLREIDDLVISQAGNHAAWEAPVEVRRNKPGSFSIPPDLAERAAFLAKIHRAPGVERLARHNHLPKITIYLACPER